MRHTPTRLALVALAPALLLLAGCDNSGSNVEAALASSSVDNSPTANALPILTRGRLVLPAVADHPAVAYFTLGNQGANPAVVTNIVITGTTNATMHQTVGGAMQPLPTVTIPAGGFVDFAPGGKHVMVDGVSPALTVGKKTDATLTLADGRRVSGKLTIESQGIESDAGSADGAMSGMKM